MKKILFALVAFCTFASCEKDKSYPELVSETDLTMTIASEKLYGIFFDECTGWDIISHNYAVKQGNNSQWEFFFHGIEGFEYEKGNEYSLRVKKVRMYDPRNSVQYWDEYTIVDELAKEKKTSVGLPESFMPSYYSNETDDAFIIYPTKYTINSKGEVYLGGRNIGGTSDVIIYAHIKAEIAELIEQESVLATDYVPSYARVITDSGEVRSISWGTIGYLREILLIKDIERIITMDDGSEVNYTFELYNLNRGLIQETTFTFTYDANFSI